MFSDAYINYIKKICNDLIHFFGYSTIDGIENKAGVFKYDQVKEEDKQKHYKYLEFNKEMKDWYRTNK